MGTRTPPPRWPLLRGLPGAGADLIEIGCAFTDPMADGPTIQAAGKRALAAGATLARTLAMVRDFRREDDATPIILMGYLNPVLSYGPERFCVDAASAGVDGLIVVDLPSEEADLLVPSASANGNRRDPAGGSDHRCGAPPPRARGQFGLRVLRLDHRHHRHAQRHLGRVGPRPSRACGPRPGCRSRSASACARPSWPRRPCGWRDAAVVGALLVETLAASLDAQGRAGPDTVRRVLDQVRALAAGVRGARLEENAA